MENVGLSERIGEPLVVTCLSEGESRTEKSRQGGNVETNPSKEPRQEPR